MLLFPPMATYVMGSRVRFTWTNAGNESYCFAIYHDEAGSDSLIGMNVPDTSLIINLDSLKLIPDKSYYWTAGIQGQNACTRWPFQVLSQSKEDQVRSEIDSIEKDKSLSKDVKCIVKAAYFEKNFLYIEAREQYLNAINLAPGKKIYKEIYTEFNERIKPFKYKKKHENSD